MIERMLKRIGSKLIDQEKILRTITSEGKFCIVDHKYLEELSVMSYDLIQQNIKLTKELKRQVYQEGFKAAKEHKQKQHDKVMKEVKQAIDRSDIRYDPKEKKYVAKV